MRLKRLWKNGENCKGRGRGRVERGKKIIGVDKFINIVKALGVSADYVLCNEIPTGEPYVFDEITEKLKKLDPKQRKTAIDILDGYLKNL